MCGVWDGIRMLLKISRERGVAKERESEIARTKEKGREREIFNVLVGLNNRSLHKRFKSKNAKYTIF